MRHTKLPYLACLALLVTVTYSALAQQQPCTKPLTFPAATEPNIFTEEQEVVLGDAVAESIQHNYKVIEDPEVTAYLTSIGERLTKHLPINRFPCDRLQRGNAAVVDRGRPCWLWIPRRVVTLA